ncbi:MAG: phenylacetate--CoA ligase family protein [Desulfomonilaceae bacterium]
MRPREYFNELMETIRPDGLSKLQQDKMARQLDYVCEKSAFYQRKFGEHRIQRRDIKGLDDLAKLPFTERDELRQSQEEHPPLGLHGVASMENAIRIHASWGPTGMPVFTGITGHDHEVWNEITARSLFTEGVGKHDIVIQATGLSCFVGGLPVKDAIEYIGASLVQMESGAYDQVIAATNRLNATVLHCTPTYALHLAEHCRKKHGLEPSEMGFKKLAVGAEPGGGLPSIRTKLEEDYQARVTEGLGNSDAAPIIFGECLEQNGMHFCAQEYIYCELIDPDNGKILEMKDGAEGELVYSLIDRECCPLIRFRTRDRVTVFTEPCACGRTSFRVRCMGRTDDMLIVSGVNVFPAAIKDVVASFRPKTTGEMLVLLDRPSHTVESPVHILAEYVEGMTDLASLKKTLGKELHHKLLFQADVELVREGTLPRHGVKARLVKIMYG